LWLLLSLLSLLPRWCVLSAEAAAAVLAAGCLAGTCADGLLLSCGCFGWKEKLPADPVAAVAGALLAGALGLFDVAAAAAVG
jgi:hypothetical protein